VLKRIFGPKRKKWQEAGCWRRLHNEKFHKMYATSNIISVIRSKRMNWVGHVAHMGEIRNAYKSLVGRPEGKRPLGRPRRRWKDNNRISLGEIVWEGVDWIHLAQDRD
jgi:hypothetical protein